MRLLVVRHWRRAYADAMPRDRIIALAGVALRRPRDRSRRRQALQCRIFLVFSGAVLSGAWMRDAFGPSLCRPALAS
jgi:hypothetical protein